MVENGRRRLTSWKEIASYMGRDVRTVLRWEKLRGLPVHRVPGPTGRVVFAYTDELDAWAHGAKAEPDPESAAESVTNSIPEVIPPSSDRSRGRRPMVLAAVGIVAVVIGATAWVTTRSKGTGADRIAQTTLTDTTVRALNAEGGTLWTYPIGGVIIRLYSLATVTDLNGDSRPDVVASLIMKDASTTPVGILLALDHRGRKLWERQVEDTLTFGSDSYGPPWGPDDLSVYTVGGQPRVGWALHHHTWWPSILATFNGRGERVTSFVNSGWIRNIVPTTDGRYLLAGGISNSREGSAFAILDPKQASGTSPEDPGTPFACRNCPSGAPVRYFVIPWSDVIDTKELGGRRGQPVSFGDGSIELRAVQYMNAEMIVELTPGLEIRRRRVSDGFWARHAELEREGTLEHSRADCPFRNGPTVHEWVPERGWRELKP